jgi:hypothetical protein
MMHEIDDQFVLDIEGSPSFPLHSVTLLEKQGPGHYHAHLLWFSKSTQDQIVAGMGDFIPAFRKALEEGMLSQLQ